MEQLIAFLNRAKKCGNGYFNRRLPELLKALAVYKNGTHLTIGTKKGGVFSNIPAHRDNLESLSAEQLKPFNPVFLKKYPYSL